MSRGPLSSASPIPTAEAAAVAEAGSSVPVIPLVAVMSGLVLVILLGALDQTIVAVALPVIANDLHGFTLMAWIVSAYLVASTVVTPIYGKLSDMYGRRNTLTSAICVFVLASAGCAMVQTMPQLIFCRILQGIGGGGLISVAQATISDVVPLRERGRYQGYISSVWALASVAGPVVGGYLTQFLSWRWIFWINLPLGLIALIVVRRSLRSLPVPRRRPRIDFIGAVLLAIGLAALLIAITRIGHGTLYSEPLNLMLAGISMLSLLVFGWHENRTAEPIIPLHLFRNRTVSICCITLFIGFVQLISMSVLLPLRSRMVAGVAADISALRLLPLTLSIPLGAFIAGRLMSKTGRYKYLQLGGSIAASLAGFAVALTTPHQVVQMALAMCLLGVGIGFQFPTALVATQNAVIPKYIGLATALTSFSRQLGGAVGVAVLTALLVETLQRALPGVMPGIGEDGDILSQLFRTVMASGGAASGAALRDVTEGAFRHLFLISACFSLLSPLLLLTLQEQELRGSIPATRP